MNVIISNKNKNILDNLNIEVIKRLDGEYSIDDIISTFQNFFFNKMIIDITAIKDYRNLNIIQKLSVSFDMNKVILFLDPNSDVSTPQYLSRIISLGIYNFTTNLEGLVYLYSNPNSYSDVSEYHHIDSLIVEDEPEVKPTLVDNVVSNGGANLDNPYIDVNTEVSNDDNSVVEAVKPGVKRIIGIKSITSGAGSTTLTYLMKKQLEKKYNVLAVEVEKRDFIYFNDKSLLSSANGVIGQILSANNDKDVILVDLNGSPAAENFCNEVLNLIEPSIIKINRLLSIKPKILNELKSKKIILCPSLLTDKDVKDFEYESGLKVFYNMKPVDDHVASEEVRNLLVKLGFDKIK